MPELTDPAYPTLTAADRADLFMLVDTDNFAESAQGTTSKITVEDLFTNPSVTGMELLADLDALGNDLNDVGVLSGSIVRDQVSSLYLNAGATTGTITFASNPTPGAKVILALANVSATPTITDNGVTPATWHHDAANTAGVNNIHIFRADAITLPASGGWQISFSSGGNTFAAQAISYLGLQSGGPYTNPDGSGAGTSASSGSANTCGLAFGAYSDSITASHTVTLTNTGFTGQGLSNSGSGARGAFAVADWLDYQAPSSQAATWTLGTSGQWEAAMVVYPANGTIVGMANLYAESFTITSLSSGLGNVEFETFNSNGTPGFLVTDQQVVQTNHNTLDNGSGGAAFAGTATSFNSTNWINVVNEYGADPNGILDSASAIQSALTAAAASGVLTVVYFPSGVYLVGTTLNIPGNVVLIGDGIYVVTIKMKNGSNLAAIAASSGWTTSSNTFSVVPITMWGITWDANEANQSSGAGHGVVLQTSYSYIEQCQFRNTRGDGLRFDYYGENGSTGITSNTAVENRVFKCQFRNNGGIGCNVNDPSFNTFTDGWIKDCIEQNAASHGIHVGAGAGWEISGNHVYGHAGSGIAVDRPYFTKAINNYIEGWGGTATSGLYCGIDFFNGGVNDGGAGSTISGNVMYASTLGNVASYSAGIGVWAVSGQKAHAVITGNMIISAPGTPPTSQYYGILLQGQNSGASVYAYMSGNLFEGDWTGGNISTAGTSATVNQYGDNTLGFDGAGNVTINGTGQPALAVNTSATGTYINPFNALAPSMTAGQQAFYLFGQAASANNSASLNFHYAGAGSTANSMIFNFFGGSNLLAITAAGVVTTSGTTLDDGAGNATFNSLKVQFGNINANGNSVTGVQQLTLDAGTATVAPVAFTAGTNLTAAAAGMEEYDGVAKYFTNDTTSGRGLVPVEQRFRLTSTGGTISTIANYFGSNSNISLVSGGEYEIEIDCWFLITTSGAVTWTFTNTAAPTSMTIDYQMSPATGIVTTAAATDLFGQQYNVTATAPTVVSGSLTSGANHRHKFKIRLINGTGTSLKIQATKGTGGTLTPGINSYWKARRVPAANVGSFAA